jgi:trimethylguanosine synthase
MLKLISQSRYPDDENDNACERSIVILDLFCGCGGNSIAFARLNEKKQEDKQSPKVKVIAVDNNLSRLKMAANNAAIYGIDENDIIFVHADAAEVLSQYNTGVRRTNGDISDKSKSTAKENEAGQDTCAGLALGGLELLPDNIDGIFLSPPWGGLNYGDGGNFDPVSSISITSSSSLLEETQQDSDTIGGTTNVTTNGGELLLAATNALSKQEGVVAYFLPRNTNGIGVGQIAFTGGITGCFEMEQQVVNGKVKTVTAYFGVVSNLCC